MVHLSLLANPSHLEAVNTCVLGKARAKQGPPPPPPPRGWPGWGAFLVETYTPFRPGRAAACAQGVALRAAAAGFFYAAGQLSALSHRHAPRRPGGVGAPGPRAFAAARGL